MKKFDLKKAILENKATFHSSLNENEMKEAMDVAKDMTDQEASGHAERFAKYMSNKEGGEFAVTAGSVEGPSFDLDLDGEKYDGGSYVILTNGDIINMAVPDKPVYANISMLNEDDAEGNSGDESEAEDMNEEKSPTKMKKSEFKNKIKEMVLAEMNFNVSDETPENEEDFLAEIEAMLAEADEEAAAEDAPAEDAPAEDETAVDDTEVAVDGEENIDVDTTSEVDPNVKAVQDSLTQAQAAAQKLGDAKLTDQIGNTITFFTRSHVVDKGAVAEGMDVQSKDEISMNEENDQNNDESSEIAKVTNDYMKLIKTISDLIIKQKTADFPDKMKLHKQINAYGNQKVALETQLIDALAGLNQNAGLEGNNETIKSLLTQRSYNNEGKEVEKDMEDDKESSMKIKEVVFPMWQRINN
jgi:hypothetical protein